MAELGDTRLGDVLADTDKCPWFWLNWDSRNCKHPQADPTEPWCGQEWENRVAPDDCPLRCKQSGSSA